MEGAIPLISEFIGESLAMRAVSRRWRSDIELDDMMFLEGLYRKHKKSLDVVVYEALFVGNLSLVRRITAIGRSLMPKELRDPSFWDRMSYITFSKDILGRMYHLVSQRARMRLDMLLGNPLSPYTLALIENIVNDPAKEVSSSSRKLLGILEDSMDHRVLNELLSLSEKKGIPMFGTAVYRGMGISLTPGELIESDPRYERFSEGDTTSTGVIDPPRVSAIAAWVDNPDLIVKTGFEPRINDIVSNARGPKILNFVATSTEAQMYMEILTDPFNERVTTLQVLSFLDRVIKLNPDSNIVNRAIAYAYELGAKEVLYAHIDKSNAIDIVSRLRDISGLDESLHPEWFLYYLKDRKLKSPISDPLFWRKLLAAALRNENVLLVSNILSKHEKDITPEIMRNIMKSAPPGMKVFVERWAQSE